jgi:hypothetical protein
VLVKMGTILGVTALLQGAVAAQESDMIRQALISLSGTISVYHEPIMTAGALSGCSFVFEHLAQDYRYLGGDFLRSSGSIGLMAAGDGQVALAVKVIAAKVVPNADLDPERFDLARAYLVGQDNSSNFAALLASYESDRPGGIFAVYDLAASSSQLFEIIEFGKTVVAVAPPGGGMDVLLPVNLNVSDTDGSGARITTGENLLQFSACLEKLLE